MNFGQDKTLSIFSSEGSIKQCENALQAALNGQISVGMASPDGTVIASLKLLPKLIDRSHVHKVVPICDTIGMTYSGLQADFRILHNKAVSYVEDYLETFGRYPDVKYFVTNYARLMQEYTQKSNMRPFGCILVITGMDGDCPQMYQIDPYGSFMPLKIAAVGKFHEEAKEFLEKKMEGIDDNVISCINVLKEYAGCEVGPGDMDIGVVYRKDGEFRVLSEEDKDDFYSNI